MAISEDQLTTWAKPGANVGSAETYGIIKNALVGTDTGEQKFSVFLQGSYGNSTNVIRDSDVDVVVQMDTIHYRDTSRLPPPQLAAYKLVYKDAAYTYTDFKKAVTTQLTKKFESYIVPGKKATLIKGDNSGRRNADVLIAAKFRRYHAFHSLGNETYDEGLCFFLADGTRIANFPVLHADNCIAKNKDTGGYFKDTVRIFKNIRNHLIDKKKLAEGIAPSYYIEGLLCSAPNPHFGTNYATTFYNVFQWLWNVDRTTLMCAHGLDPLLGEGSPTAWPAQNCTDYLSAVAECWNNWGKARWI
ncbi:MAG: hypothetical protein ABS35_26040 [Kaistia sp. SCN 65-12]|nr:MAG: hypothetical protein ABS35_26040 [Kaistia sp. SCN 65-12]